MFSREILPRGDHRCVGLCRRRDGICCHELLLLSSELSGAHTPAQTTKDKGPLFTPLPLFFSFFPGPIQLCRARRPHSAAAIPSSFHTFFPSLPPKPTTKGRGGISRLFLPPSSRPESFLLGACGNFPKVLFLPLLPLSVSSSFQITKEEGEEEGGGGKKERVKLLLDPPPPPADRPNREEE